MLVLQVRHEAHKHEECDNQEGERRIGRAGGIDSAGIAESPCPQRNRGSDDYRRDGSIASEPQKDSDLQAESCQKRSLKAETGCQWEGISMQGD
jgi:hypothetical protein